MQVVALRDIEEGTNSPLLSFHGVDMAQPPTQILRQPPLPGVKSGVTRHISAPEVLGNSPLTLFIQQQLYDRSNKEKEPKKKMSRVLGDPIRKRKIYILYPCIETDDPNLKHY